MGRPSEQLLAQLAAGTQRERELGRLLRLYGSFEEAAAVVRDYRHAHRPDSKAARDEEIFCGMTDGLPFDARDPNGLGLQRLEGRRELWFRKRILLSLDPTEIEKLGDAQPGDDD